MSKSKGVVTLSTGKVEYTATTHGSKEAIWLQRLCLGVGCVQKATTIGCDN